MKTPLAGRNALSSIRVFLIVTCIIAFTPRGVFGDIILISRLSDAEAGSPPITTPPPQSQSGILPAHLCNVASFASHGFYASGASTSNSSILINPMEGLQVVADGTASAEVHGFSAEASAKLIVLSFAVTEVSYPYSLTGQLNGANCSQPDLTCSKATAKLTGNSGTIFERVGTTLSESGTLLPGDYTLSVNVYASTQNAPDAYSDANFTFALDGPMSIATPTPTPIPATRSTNLSTRLSVGTGNSVGVAGFIISGTNPRHLLLRGIGPSLSDIVGNAFPDPSLQLNQRCFQAVTNNNWRDTQEAEIIATGRAPSDDLESAILIDLPPGVYTAILAGNNGATGVGLVEIYDLSTNQDSRLANLSTRGNVGTGNDIIIAGLILNEGNGEDTIILRGRGPTLNSGFGSLPDPKLELRDSQGALIESNDNWMDDPNQLPSIIGAGLGLSNPLESAIVATLMPGEYTALLSGVNDGTGMGLVEVYDNPVIGPTPSPSPSTPSPTPCCLDDSWRATTLIGVPPGRTNPLSVWTGSEMIVWSGNVTLSGIPFVTNSGGRYNPETDSWTATSLVNVPAPRTFSTAIWTGKEMIAWGGANLNLASPEVNSGGRYDPVSDSWTATDLTNAPTSRFYHTAVWTGSEMVVWGGRQHLDDGTVFNTGGRYNPVTNTWLPISTVNAPSGRSRHTAVWTGKEMIIWGGNDGTDLTNTGARYNPVTDTWTTLSLVNAPSARWGHTTVWTGREMIVWGGADPGLSNSGARYDPSSNSWLAIAIGPEARANHSAVWTGSEMIIWAGGGASGETNTGSRYNPDTDSWRATNPTAPNPRSNHAAVWSGREMIVWGGHSPGDPISGVSNSGGRYFTLPPPTPSPRQLTLRFLAR